MSAVDVIHDRNRNINLIDFVAGMLQMYRHANSCRFHRATHEDSDSAQYS